MSVEPFSVRDDAISYGIGGSGVGSGTGTVKFQTTSGSDISFSISMMPPTGSSYIPYGTWTSTHEALHSQSGITPTTYVEFEIRIIDNAGKSYSIGGSFIGCVGD
jgi:hypothetical protein